MCAIATEFLSGNRLVKFTGGHTPKIFKVVLTIMEGTIAALVEGGVNLIRVYLYLLAAPFYLVEIFLDDNDIYSRLT